MARRPKLTQEMVDEAIRLKADGLSNGDIICALGIHESTFHRWIGDPIWCDDTPDGNDHSIDAVRYAMMDDVLRG